MCKVHWRWARPDPFPYAALAAVWLGLAFAGAALAQVSPDEHAKHHPPQGQGTQPGTPAAQGMVGGMGGMMEHGGKQAPRELYPSLMSLPEFTPEKRAEVQSEAHERMKAGVALLSQGLDRLADGSEGENYAAMQEATGQMREGLALFESGLAAHRALAEGKAPRDVALQWFKRDMNLLPPASGEPLGGLFDLSWSHLFLMAVLVGFAAVMIWMYFHKMRRATALLQRLTTAPPSPKGEA
jgi:hypothetical protein